MPWKLYVRDDGGADQDVVEGMAFAEPWSTPPHWSGVGTTHREESVPGGDIKSPLRKKGAFLWKVTAGAWVVRSEGEKASEELAQSRADRIGETCRLQSERDAFQSLIDDPSTPAGMVTDLTTERDAIDAKIDSHQAEWDNVWTPGTNP
jgi:hypothetical protein